jgi:hypothetical protein
MVADHLEGDALAGCREQHALVRRMLHQVHLGELLHHAGDGARLGATLFAEQRGGDGTILLLERIDRL